MNPYRVCSDKTKINETIQKFANFPQNPANDLNNLIIGEKSVILDPGSEVVRKFIIDTVKEFLKKYNNVDAIHFDDYFYIKVDNGEKTREEKKRENINILLKSLHEEIISFNLHNNKHVQFGISPTGIYKNGNGIVKYDSLGNAITSGSETNGQEHYEYYLYCDSLRWINEGWIDYILPQSYWSFEQSNANFSKVTSWWNKVAANKKINLYSGIGLYKCNEVDTFGWLNEDGNELFNQLNFINNEEFSNNIDGVSIYNFRFLLLNNNIPSVCHKLIENGMKIWKTKVPPSVIKSFDEIKLPKPENFKLEDNNLSFNKVKDSKFYVVYRSEGNIEFNSSEIVDIFGSDEENVTWKDTLEGTFNYGVKALSYSNTLGEGSSSNTLKEEVLNDYGRYLSSRFICLVSMITYLL